MSIQEEKINNINILSFFKRNPITGTINFISWILLAFSAIVACIIFFILNKTTVKDRKYSKPNIKFIICL